MKRWLKHSSILLLSLGLVACASPQTVGPHASADEIRAEATTQENYLREMRASGLVLGGKNKKSAQPRLEKTAAKIAPATIAMCRDLRIPDPESCAYSIKLVKSETPDANTNGELVEITTGMVRYTDNDTELAFIVAHEFSHNIMQHHASKMQNMLAGALIGALADGYMASQGVQTYGGGATGDGARIGALAYSPAFEHEADYIALYILARAGYDYHKAPDFWRRFVVASPDAIYTATTHPTHPERYVVMRKTIAEIDAKKKAKQPLLPEFKKGA